jgi:hypothetical protein
MYTSCLHNISKNKPPLYKVPNKISKNKIIPLVQTLTQLKERLISPCFAQIYKLKGYGQYRCMVVLLMSLEMWIKFNQYYHIYHMMVQQ